MFKNGTNLNRMETGLSSVIFITYIKIATCTKSGYAKPGKFGLGINVDNYQQK